MDENCTVKSEKPDKAKTEVMDKNAEKCSNGCNKYTKSMDEVLKATSKHRDAALALKEISTQQKKKISWYREQLIEMQSQIDKLEHDNDTEKEMVGQILNEKKILEEKVYVSNKEAERMVILKEELEVEVERLKHNQETLENPKNEIENVKLKRKLEIYDKVIEELKFKSNSSSKVNKELQDNLKMSCLLDKVKKEDLEKELLEHSEENNELLKRIDNLSMKVIDQKEEIDGMKNEMDRKDSNMTNSSCGGSIADEIESANHKLEKDRLQEEVEFMKTKFEHLEKSKKKRFDQLNKLEQLSTSRNQVISKIKSSLENLKQKKKKLNQERTPKCNYGWKCRRGRQCKFDHTYLYKKVNNSIVSDQFCPLLEVTESSRHVKEPFPCDECNVSLKTRKKLRKHQQRVHKHKCEICAQDFPSIFKLEQHVQKTHKEKTETENSQKTEAEVNTVEHVKAPEIILNSVIEIEDSEINVADEEHESTELVLDKVNLLEKEWEAPIIRENETEINQDNLTNNLIIEVYNQEAKEEKTVSEKNIDSRKCWEEFECEVCKKDCKNLEDIDNHMETKHIKYIMCGVCEITFQGIRKINIHMDEEHDGSGKLNDPGVLREGERWA